MNGGPDESTLPGECPLCLVGLDEPSPANGVLPILASHFGASCEATLLPGPGTLA